MKDHNEFMLLLYSVVEAAQERYPNKTGSDLYQEVAEELDNAFWEADLYEDEEE